jgi:putative transposase
VSVTCGVLNVSRSGYYAWKSRRPSKRYHENETLLKEIEKVYCANRKVYGSPRIHAVLIAQGHKCGVNRIAKIMRENDIQAQQHRNIKRKVIYRSTVKVDNLVARQFDVTRPNKIWAADITGLWTGTGWLNLAIVMDLYSRRIIGWSMQSRMTEQMTISALDMALLNRKPQHSLVHHSDQGSQYQSQALQERLKKHKIIPSMSRKGDCWDNAVVESFFKTLKSELGAQQSRFKTREEAKAMIFEYIEVFYNKKRIHSTLGYVSPVEFEMKNDNGLSVH